MLETKHLKSYVCTKTVSAMPMSRQEAQRLGLVRDPFGTGEEGYYVKYSDSYVSWSPKAAFEEGYTSTDEHNNEKGK